VTEDVRVPGNPDYLAPELTRGQPVTPAADVYSLGILLLEMLLGKKPFVGDSPELTATAHVIRPAPSAPDGLPSDLRCFVALMVDKEPRHRPDNALAVGRMVEQGAEGLRS
jgi:serine/threonine-protein kinase